MKKTQRNTGSNPALKKTGGLRPLAPMLAVLVTLSGCAYMPASWKDGAFPWDIGGKGKWASSVGQQPQAPADQPEAEEPVRDAVADVQGKLAELGYKPGPVDGIPGPATQAAIRHYQKDAGLPADGKVSETLVARLRQPAPPRSKIARPEPPRQADPVPPPKADSEPPPKADPKILVIGYQRDDLLPDYAAGDTYAWSDGAIERVLRTRGDTVWWSRTGDVQYSAPRSFVLPMLQWKTPLGTGRTAVGMDAAGAWPAADGTALSFTVHESDSDSAVRAQEWTCLRTGSGQTAVPAGTFRTIAIACERTGAAPDVWHKRVWQYAPAVRHYVRRDDFVGASEEPRRADLIAVRLGANDWPPAARGGLDQAIQKSLDNKALGEQTKWKSTAVDHSFVIQPTGDSKRYGWDRCRTYVVERITPDSPRAWPGLACRGARSDRWIVPVLDEQKGSLAKVSIN